MFEFIRPGMSIAEHRRMENAVAEAERNKAYVDYIAMMVDVQLPTHEENTEVIEDEG